jgi:hypothetical protein
MATIKETFDNCEIIIQDDVALSINGKPIGFKKNTETGKWLSRYLPYTEYDSLLDLAKAIVRDTVEFTHVNP